MQGRRPANRAHRDQLSPGRPNLPAVLAATAALWLGTMPLTPSPAPAQVVPAPPALNIDGEPEEIRDLEMVEKLGDTAPLDLELVNETGETVRLGDFFQADRPVVINLGYYGCPMLCGQVIRGLGMSLHELEQNDGWVPGVDYEVVTVSFDPEEGPELAREAKTQALRMLSDERAGEGWHFLTGSEQNVRALADAVGFPYRWAERSQQYVHPAAVMLLTPDGVVSRYLYGVSFPTMTLRLSLVEASEHKVGSTMDQILLYCFEFDANHGQYTLVAVNLMRLAAAMTVIVLGIAIGVMTLRGMRRQAAYADPDADHERSPDP